jgi:hypothetical protein
MYCPIKAVSVGKVTGEEVEGKTEETYSSESSEALDVKSRLKYLLVLQICVSGKNFNTLKFNA